MSDEPVTDAPLSADEQDAPAEERPPADAGYQPAQAEGEDDDGDETDEDGG